MTPWKRIICFATNIFVKFCESQNFVSVGQENKDLLKFGIKKN